MVGCVGSDAYGQELRNALLAEGIDCQAVEVVEGVSSGVAAIMVDAASQNTILIVAGSNGRLLPAAVQRFEHLLAEAEVLVCQMEVPPETVAFSLALGRRLGKKVILNPAPVQAPLPAEWYADIDYLIPNERELEALTGLVVSGVGEARTAAARLLELGAQKVIVTLGAEGALFASTAGYEHFPAPIVEPLDTTAAGDTFVGGFAAALAQGRSEPEAVALGQRAAAISVTRAGAQSSIPRLADLA